MSDLQFEEETFKSRGVVGESTSSKMAKTLMKLGVVKNERQAERLLIAIAAICFILAIFVSYSFLFASKVSKPTPEEEQRKAEFLENLRSIQNR